MARLSGSLSWGLVWRQGFSPGASGGSGRRPLHVAPGNWLVTPRNCEGQRCCLKPAGGWQFRSLARGREQTRRVGLGELRARWGGTLRPPARGLCQDKAEQGPALSGALGAGAVAASLPEAQPEARAGSEFPGRGAGQQRSRAHRPSAGPGPVLAPARTRLPGSRHPAPGTRPSAPGTRPSAPGTQVKKSKAKCLGCCPTIKSPVTQAFVSAATVGIPGTGHQQEGAEGDVAPAALSVRRKAGRAMGHPQQRRRH